MPEAAAAVLSAFYDYDDLSEPVILPIVQGNGTLDTGLGPASTAVTSALPSGAILGGYTFDLLAAEAVYPLQDALPKEQNVSTFTGTHKLDTFLEPHVHVAAVLFNSNGRTGV